MQRASSCNRAITCLADVVVTATGLRLALAGKVEVSKDGSPVDWTDHFFYRGTMFSNLPNLSFVFGYLNASWTLRADCNARYACEVLNAMASAARTLPNPCWHPLTSRKRWSRGITPLAISTAPRA